MHALENILFAKPMIRVLVISSIILAIHMNGNVRAEDDADSSAEGNEVGMDQQFAQQYWEEMRALMEKDGAPAVIDFINSFKDNEERRSLYSFAQQSFAYQDWSGKNFDDYIAVVQAGIAEGLRQCQEAKDQKTADACKDFANVLSYNLSADLAECWPGDTMPREKRHFETGLAAAQDCIRWREELHKGPFPFSIAYWAKGMHQMSLGDIPGCIESFQKAFDYGLEYAKEQNLPPQVSAAGDFLVILNGGYLGIARWLSGDEAGKTLYQEAISAFQEQIKQYPEKKDDAQFGIDQLEYVQGKFIKE
jgi:tetratricopeptide (TPR) repeat protein